MVECIINQNKTNDEVRREDCSTDAKKLDVTLSNIKIVSAKRAQNAKWFKMFDSNESKKVPVQGLEPWYPAWEASMLTTYIIPEAVDGVNVHNT